MAEILSQRPGGAGCHSVVEKESAELLARAENLPTTRPVPAVIAGGQVEQLERARQRPVEPVGSLCLPRDDRPLHLAARVRQLLGKRECAPAAGGEGGVSCHVCPSPSTSPVTT